MVQSTIFIEAAFYSNTMLEVLNRLSKPEVVRVDFLSRIPNKTDKQNKCKNYANASMISNKYPK